MKVDEALTMIMANHHRGDYDDGENDDYHFGGKKDEFKANVVVLRLTMVMIRNTRSCILARLFVRRGSRFRSDCTLV